MKKQLLSIGVLSALVLTSTTAARADSYAGSDWLFNLSGVLTAPLVGTLALNVVNEPITIGQSSASSITIPVNFPPYFNSTVNATVTGTNVKGSVNIATVIIPSGTISGVNFDLRLQNITVNLVGNATGINPGEVEAFGPRVHDITGVPSTDPFSTNPNTTWATIQNVQVPGPFNTWITIGSATVSVSSWNATRPVPEPASMIALGTGLVGLLAARRRRTR